MAAAIGGAGKWDIHFDPDIRELVEAARDRNNRPATMTRPAGWMMKEGKP
jgi:hypothetical protein